MKKLIYVLLFSFVSAIAFSACTEEEVAPATELDNGSGSGSADGKN